MFYYGFINDQSICTGTYGFPTEVTIPNYIYIGTTDDKTVIGKKWTGNGWVEVIYFFYAQLNEKDLCIGVQEYPTEVIDARLIRIETLDESLIGFWYDRTDSTFKPAPIRVLAVSRASRARMVFPVLKVRPVRTALPVRMDFLVEMANAVRRAILGLMVATVRMAETVRMARTSAAL